MRLKKRTFLPSVEALEDRWVPAKVTLSSGYLFISPDTNEAALNLTVKQTTPNKFTVTDGATTSGPYGPVSNINITGANGADSITVDLNGQAYTGSLTASTGNGNDTVSLENSVAGAAFLGGNVTINTGAGNDRVNLAALNPVNIGGTVQLTDTLGANTAVFGNGTGPSTVGKDLIITGYNNVFVGGGQADRVGGSLTVNDNFLALPVTVLTGDNLTINTNLNLYTGSGADTITIESTTVNGNTQVNTGGGDDVLSVAGGKAATFNGNLSITGGSGSDLVAIANSSTVTVGGDLSINLGDGNDTITLNAAITLGVSTLNVNGNLRITLGSGADSVTVEALVNGNMYFNLGNGNDTVTIGNAPGGVLNWTSGNGNNSVTLGDSSTQPGEFWNVNMRFGTGSDTLTLNPIVGPQSISGFVDMGGPPGGNTFSQGANWTIVAPWTLQNV